MFSFLNCMRASENAGEFSSVTKNRVAQSNAGFLTPAIGADFIAEAKEASLAPEAATARGVQVNIDVKRAYRPSRQMCYPSAQEWQKDMDAIDVSIRLSRTTEAQFALIELYKTYKKTEKTDSVSALRLAEIHSVWSKHFPDQEIKHIYLMEKARTPVPFHKRSGSSPAVFMLPNATVESLQPAAASSSSQTLVIARPSSRRNNLYGLRFGMREESPNVRRAAHRRKNSIDDALSKVSSVSTSPSHSPGHSRIPSLTELPKTTDMGVSRQLFFKTKAASVIEQQSRDGARPRP